jgi:hypothetical protein
MNADTGADARQAWRSRSTTRIAAAQSDQRAEPPMGDGGKRASAWRGHPRACYHALLTSQRQAAISPAGTDASDSDPEQITRRLEGVLRDRRARRAGLEQHTTQREEPHQEPTGTPHGHPTRTGCGSLSSRPPPPHRPLSTPPLRSPLDATTSGSERTPAIAGRPHKKVGRRGCATEAGEGRSGGETTRRPDSNRLWLPELETAPPHRPLSTPPLRSPIGATDAREREDARQKSGGPKVGRRGCATEGGARPGGGTTRRPRIGGGRHHRGWKTLAYPTPNPTPTLPPALAPAPSLALPYPTRIPRGH